MVAALDLTGQRFGRLVALRRLAATFHGKTQWEFACDCGRLTVTTGTLVKRGITQSCGCLNNEARAARAPVAGQARGAQLRKHGAAGTAEYNIWKAMRQRCENPRSSDYADYGARGISVCDAWRDFATFLHDMGPRPTASHSIDRIDNSKGYAPDNCRWATSVEQANNRRKRRR